jgi:hypothetical protein
MMIRQLGFLCVGLGLCLIGANENEALGEEFQRVETFVAPAVSKGWYSGFDIVIAKPLYSNNLGLSESIQPSSQQISIENVEFDYDYQSSPRVWIGYQSSSQLGLRATWWQLANQANEISRTPSVSGFGSIEHPGFGDIDISAITPNESMIANANLDVYAIDLEITRSADLGPGQILIGSGIRFAALEQNYSAQLLNSNSAIAGAIDYRQQVRGIGPTVSSSFSRSLTSRWSWFAGGRGSLLVGEGKERLDAGEDLDFANPQRTRETSFRDQLLPILDLQLGSSMQLPCVGVLQPMVRGGWEASWWGDVGNNSGGASDLGFVGFFVGCEATW